MKQYLARTTTNVSYLESNAIQYKDFCTSSVHKTLFNKQTNSIRKREEKPISIAPFNPKLI